MELSIGKELNQEKFQKLFNNRKLGYLTLNEIIDIAMNGEGMNSGVGSYRLWTFSGAYYKYDVKDIPILIIDREFNCEYNNSELVIKEYNGEIFSNDSTFENLVKNKVAEKTKFIDTVKKSAPFKVETRKTNTKLRINAGATYGPFNEIDSL